MSRIDEALRMRDAAKGAAPSEVPATQLGRSFPLNHYPQEEPARYVTEAPAATHTPEPVLRPVLIDDVDLRARLVTTTPSNVSLEQYRRLAAVLHDEQARSQLKTVMVTSALPHEGKTLTVVNLALTLSESYARRVLVIDADLRSPSVHTVVGVPNARGLSEALLTNHHELPLIQMTNRFSVMTAGRPGPALLAGLTSARMGEVLDECAARFDWVLVDTPPAGVLPDAQVLTRLMGAVLLVIGAGTTPAAAVERAVAELGGPDAIDGIVLNRVDDRHIAESDYYEHYRKPANPR